MEEILKALLRNYKEKIIINFLCWQFSYRRFGRKEIDDYCIFLLNYKLYPYIVFNPKIYNDLLIIRSCFRSAHFCDRLNSFKWIYSATHCSNRRKSRLAYFRKLYQKFDQILTKCFFVGNIPILSQIMQYVNINLKSQCKTIFTQIFISDFN